MICMGRLERMLHTLSGKDLIRRNGHNLNSTPLRVLLFIPWYLLTLVHTLLDLLFIGNLVSAILKWTSSKKRLLAVEEMIYLSDLPRDQFYLAHVTVIEQSWLARFGAWLTRRKQLGLGIGTTVHFSRTIDTTQKGDLGWLLHEVAHTLQFRYRGTIYIPEALIAQRFSGYAFGGKQTLRNAKLLKDFNPEQQADIFKILLLSDQESELNEEIRRGGW